VARLDYSNRHIALLPLPLLVTLPDPYMYFTSVIAAPIIPEIVVVMTIRTLHTCNISKYKVIT